MFLLAALVVAGVSIPRVKLPRAGTAWRYATALLAVIFAVLVRLALTPVLGPDQMPYITLFCVIVFCAVYCGVGPSIVAVAAAVFANFYFFTAPVFTLHLDHPLQQIGGMFMFMLTSGFVIWMAESKRRVQANTEGRIRAATATISSLSASLLRSQDNERRQIARGLHDSVGQLLAATSMNLASLDSMSLGPNAAGLVSDTSSLVKETSEEIRTISHLLHPPLLEEVGLFSALEWYVKGFSDRSRIEVMLNGGSHLSRYDADVEIAVYRLVQECLTNIHRHSGSRRAMVQLSENGEGLEIVVEDNGSGLPPEMLDGSDVHLGVGLLGMKQRISQLGGNVQISSSPAGTVVRAKLPVHPIGGSAR